MPIIIIILAVFIYFGLSAIIASIIASPRCAPAPGTPADVGLAFEDVSFVSRVDRLPLKGWFIPGGSKGNIVVVHGGKQTRVDPSMKLLELCAGLSRNGFNIFTFDRRGCGESGVAGRRARSRFERDVGGAIDFIRNRVPGEDWTAILGVSIGAVSALLYAGHDKNLKGVISDSCFASTTGAAGRVLRKHNRTLGLLLPGVVLMGWIIYSLRPLKVEKLVRAVACPVMFIHCENDDTAQVLDTRRLFAASKNTRSELWEALGCKHSQAYSSYPEEYIRRVTEFLIQKCFI